LPTPIFLKTSSGTISTTEGVEMTWLLAALGLAMFGGLLGVALCLMYGFSEQLYPEVEGGFSDDYPGDAQATIIARDREALGHQ
jgi:hypothetical protein